MPQTCDVFDRSASFEPTGDFEAFLKQVPALNRLYEARQRLRDLLTKLDGNDELDALLREVVENTEAQGKLREQLAAPAANGADTPAPAATDGAKTK